MYKLRSADGLLLDLGPGDQILGRAPDCDLVVPDPRISRHHARLTRRGDALQVRDLNSHNGLFVNGRRVATAALTPGDRLAFGPVEFQVVGQGPAAAAPGSAPPEAPATLSTVEFRERARLLDTPPLDSQRLQGLHEILETLVGGLHLEDSLSQVLRTLKDLFAYDHCAVGGREPDGRLTTWCGYPGQSAIPFSRSVVERVLEGGEALLYDDVQGQAPFDLGESVLGLNIRSVMCAPLRVRGHLRGILYVDRSVPGAYEVGDLALLRSVSHVVAIAAENARLYGNLRERLATTAEELATAQRQLLESQRSAVLGRLAQALAHEVRNPVLVIAGLARRLGRARLAGPEGELLPVLLQEAQRLEGIVERVEAVLELPPARLRSSPLEVTVAAALGSGADTAVESSLAGRPVPHDPDLTARAVAAVLEVGRARSPDTPRWVVRLGEQEAGWVIAVGDGAPRPAEQELHGFYDPFFAAHPWADHLGLALASAAVARQGGELRLSGAPEHGAYAELILPEVMPEGVAEPG